MELALRAQRELPRWQALGLSLALHALVALLLIGGSGLGRHVLPGQQALHVTMLPPARPAAAAPLAPRRLRHATALPAREAATKTLPASPAEASASPASSPAVTPTPAGPAPAAATLSAASPGASPDDFTPARADASYLNNPEPAYPRLARLRGEEGLVLLRVVVSAAGLPLSVSVADSSRHGLLDQAAVSAVSGWRFVPARRAGAAVEDTVRVPVRFRLQQG